MSKSILFMCLVPAFLVASVDCAKAEEGSSVVVRFRSDDGNLEKERAVTKAFAQVLREEGSSARVHEGVGGEEACASLSCVDYYEGSIAYDGKRTKLRIEKRNREGKPIARIVVTNRGGKVASRSLKRAARYLVDREAAADEDDGSSADGKAGATERFADGSAQRQAPEAEGYVLPNFNYQRELRRKRAGIILSGVVAPLLLAGTAVAVPLLLNRAASEDCGDDHHGPCIWAGVEYAIAAVFVGMFVPVAAISLFIVGLVKYSRGKRRTEKVTKGVGASGSKWSFGLDVAREGLGGRLSVSVRF